MEILDEEKIKLFSDPKITTKKKNIIFSLRSLLII